jgi:hypothetical protein
MRRRICDAILLLLPLLIVTWIGLSALSFVPVPWPDDSAFYFVGRELFKWPPRWVMLPQAPFEPTYRIYNFNTMPLYPILVGLGRLVGIDGSHAIKVWPLGAYGLSGSLLGFALYRRGLPFVLALLVSLTMMLDPGMRWAAVLVRPESLIGLFGMALVLGLSLGFPERLRPRGLWHPVSALLAGAAYAHFNAVHLLFPVVLVYLLRPWELVAIGLRSLLYLVPWLATVALHPVLFSYQMHLQWKRLVYHNDWLDSFHQAIHAIFQDMGSPEPWPDSLYWASYAVWALLIAAAVFGLLLPLVRLRPGRPAEPLVAPAGWILGSVWLWLNKPEVWFNYYVHLSVWAFAGIALWVIWRSRPAARWPEWARFASLGALCATLLPSAALFGVTDLAQAERLGAARSWHWSVYHELIGCIDQELRQAEARLGYPKPFRVWDPTFPDVTVELSRLHPDWEFTRTNDFNDRILLALRHGHDVEAVVVPEMLNWPDREISGPQSEYPDVKSVWMLWREYFLNRLWEEPGWKPNRYLCQRGRWQAFIFEK